MNTKEATLQLRMIEEQLKKIFGPNVIVELHDEGLLIRPSKFPDSEIPAWEPFYIYETPVPESHPCSRCSNHPDNGGSGICHCTIPYFSGVNQPLWPQTYSLNAELTNQLMDSSNVLAEKPEN